MKTHYLAVRATELIRYANMDSAVGIPEMVPVELASTEGGTIEVINISSEDDLNLTLDISSSSDVEMVRGPGLG